MEKYDQVSVDKLTSNYTEILKTLGEDVSREGLLAQNLRGRLVVVIERGLCLGAAELRVRGRLAATLEHGHQIAIALAELVQPGARPLR